MSDLIERLEKSIRAYEVTCNGDSNACGLLREAAARIRDLETTRITLMEINDDVQQAIFRVADERDAIEAATIERLAQRAFLAGCGKPGCTDCIGGALAAKFRTIAKPIQPLPLASEERKD